MGVLEILPEKEFDMMKVDVPDMTKISNINIHIINGNLSGRYSRDVIYTYIDNILLAINPYKELNIYGLDSIRKYEPSKDPLAQNVHLRDTTPHIYSITQKCFTQLSNPIVQSIPQSILISGESGSGKTETSKFVLQYLCEISSNENYWLQEQILEGNIILEAFGNATTVRNNNSSRFGKFLQIYFKQNAITGAVVTNYLLEKSRIVGQSENERNYHIFYQLLSNETSMEKHGLIPIEYKYCNGYVPKSNSNPTDRSNWNHLLVSLNILEFSSEMINTIFNLLSVILWFGNIEFSQEDADGETSQLTSESLKILDRIASLLNLPKDALTTLLLQRQITIRGVVTDIPFRPSEASDNRHSMSQYLYMKIFNYLVNFINGRINRENQQNSTFVGLLDIFGFENFAKNSFEQICINYSNEKLQGYFNEYIFRVQQEVYQSEGLDYSYISYLDNSGCLDFLERAPRSLVKLLSEQCHLPKGSDGAFLQNLTKEHLAHSCFSLPTDRRLWNEQFNVIHYAGSVKYTVEGFVNKNRHLVQEGFHNYLLDNEIIRTIITSNEKTPTATLKYKSTLIDDFRQELGSLMNVLQSSEPWYIRCLKPNLDKSANNYDSEYIMEQLTYLGILDLVKIKQNGYPVNYPFDEFINKYKILTGSKKLKPNIDDIIAKVNEKSVMKFRRPQDYQFGNSKVFIKSTLHNAVESARNQLILEATIKIQSFWRSYLEKSSYKRKIQAAEKIQRYYRSLKQRLHFLKLKKSALTLQSHLRGKFGREVVKSMREVKRIEKELRMREEERRNSTTLSSNYNSVDELLDLLLNEESGVLTDPNSSTKNEVKPSESINSSIVSLIDEDYDMNEEESEEINENESYTSDFDRSTTILSPIQSSAPSEDSDLSSEPPFSGTESVTDHPSLPPPPEFMEKEPSIKPVLHPIKSNMNRMSAVEQLKATQHKLIVKHQPSLPEPTLPPPPPPPVSTSQARVLPTKKIVTGKNGAVEPIYESIRLANGGISAPPSSNTTIVKDPLKSLNTSTSQTTPSTIIPKIPDCPPPPVSYVATTPTNSIGISSTSPPRKVVVNGRLPTDHSSSDLKSEESEEDSPSRSSHDSSSQLQNHQHQQMNMNPQSFDLINYANDFFNDMHECTLMDTLKKKPKLVSKTDMIKFTKCNTISTSHIYLYDPHNIQTSLNLWKDLQRYLPSSRSGVSFIRTLVTHGIQQEELRDEIYIQLMRQLNGNPNFNQSLKLINLLQFIVRIFPCSPELKKYFGPFLNKIGMNAEDGRINSHVNSLLKTSAQFWSARKEIPSLIEINYYFQNTQQLIHHVKLYLLNNSYLLLNIDPTDTYGSLLGKLSLLLKTDFVDDGTWGIYESNMEFTEMYYLQKYDPVYDLIASWERSEEITFQANTPNLLLMNPRKKLVLKKRLYKPTLPSPTHPLDINLSYLQCIHEIVRLDKYLVTEKIALALAGIQLQLIHGNYKENLEYRVEDALPPRLLRSRKIEQWIPLMEDSHYQISQLKENKFALQLRYFNCVRKLNFYGTTMFTLNYYGYRDYDPHLLLGVNASQLLLMQQDLTVLNSISYEEIQSLQVQEQSLVLNLSSTKFVFKTKFTDDIFTLITSYYPKLKRTDSKSTNILVTNSFRSKLWRELIEARNLLISNNYLNIDGSTLKSSKSRKNATLYFNYSKGPLAHSLLRLSQTEESTALEIFRFILTYTHSDGQLKPFLAKMTNSNLLNETYLQLIKQTNSTMPNSNMTRKTWAILNLLANYLLPTNKLITNYLLSHLKYFSLDTVTSVGDYARMVMKSLQNTNSHNKLTKTIRKYIPSSIEINYVIHFKPISIKVFLLNNNYYTVELANHYDAIQDVLRILFNYIGLDESDSRGYGIYETNTTNGNYSEIYLTPSTSVIDVLSRWELDQSPSKNPNSSKHKFIFKKYLTKYLNLNSSIEKELLLQQLLFNIKIHKYPINTNEGEILIALLSQIHLGDYEKMDPGEFPDYCSILSKYFPTNLSVNISYERVSYYHQSLVGTKAEESYKSIFNLLTSWPLYKGSVFSVVQSFTPSWPRNLWLIVDETGVFLLEERTKNVIANYNYTDLLNYIPTTNYLMLIVQSEAKGVKIILHTNESYNITYLIREYINTN